MITGETLQAMFELLPRIPGISPALVNAIPGTDLLGWIPARIISSPSLPNFKIS